MTERLKPPGSWHLHGETLCMVVGTWNDAAAGLETLDGQPARVVLAPTRMLVLCDDRLRTFTWRSRGGNDEGWVPDSSNVSVGATHCSRR